MGEIKNEILELLEDHPSGLSVKEVANQLNYHRNTVSPRLRELHQKDKLKVKKTGRAKQYYLKHHAMIAEGAKHKERESEKNAFAGVGISKKDNPFEAGKEAVKMAIEKAGKPPEFGIVFCSGEKYGRNERSISKLVKGAHQAYTSSNPNCKWIGCTSVAEISNYGLTENSCVAIALTSKYINVGIGVSDKVSESPVNRGKSAATESIKDIKLDKYFDSYIQFLTVKKKNPEFLMTFKPYMGIALAPGSTMNYVGCESKVLEGITEVFGSRHIPVLGGSASDGAFRQTYQFANGEVYKDAIVIAYLVLYLNNESVVAHGYSPTSKTAFINQSKGKLVTEMNDKDSKSAYLDLTSLKYKDIEGSKLAEVGVKYPLGMMDVDGRYWIKSPQASLEEGLLFFADIPSDSTLNLMRPNPKESLSCVRKSLHDLDGDAAFSLIFDCLGRKTYLGEKTNEEIKIVKDKLEDKPFLGFYTFGEFGYDSKTPLNMVNGTFVSLVVKDELVTD